MGINTGIEYSFVDSNVVDGVEYTYTVTAYDIGLAPFSMDYSEVDSSGIYVSDTVWSLLNPGKVYPILRKCAEEGRLHIHGRDKSKFSDIPRF